MMGRHQKTSEDDVLSPLSGRHRWADIERHQKMVSCSPDDVGHQKMMGRQMMGRHHGNGRHRTTRGRHLDFLIVSYQKFEVVLEYTIIALCLY